MEKKPNIEENMLITKYILSEKATISWWLLPIQLHLDAGFLPPFIAVYHVVVCTFFSAATPAPKICWQAACGWSNENKNKGVP